MSRGQDCQSAAPSCASCRHVQRTACTALHRPHPPSHSPAALPGALPRLSPYPCWPASPAHAAADARAARACLQLTCRACEPSEALEGFGGESSGMLRTAKAVARGEAAAGAPPCRNLLDLCPYWAREEGLCAAAATDLQRLWWVAVACRRTCGLCGREQQQQQHGLPAGADGAAGPSNAAVAAAGGSSAEGDAASAIAAAAAHGVQIGIDAAGRQRVAPFERIPDDASSCSDQKVGGCGCKPPSAAAAAGGGMGANSMAS
jgi:hypothetical protein